MRALRCCTSMLIPLTKIVFCNVVFLKKSMRLLLEKSEVIGGVIYKVIEILGKAVIVSMMASSALSFGETYDSCFSPLVYGTK